VQGRRGKRISILGALLDKKFLAPFIFEGGCNKDIFNAWLEHVLLPTIPSGTTIVMDNASFHKSAKTRELIEQANCRLLFLPTYSPDFNPIENWWHKIKSILRPLVQVSPDQLVPLVEQCLLNI
jgi:transposase